MQIAFIRIQLQAKSAGGWEAPPQPGKGKVKSSHVITHQSSCPRPQGPTFLGVSGSSGAMMVVMLRRLFHSASYSSANEPAAGCGQQWQQTDNISKTSSKSAAVLPGGCFAQQQMRSSVEFAAAG